LRADAFWGEEDIEVFDRGRREVHLIGEHAPEGHEEGDTDMEAHRVFEAISE